MIIFEMGCLLSEFPTSRIIAGLRSTVSIDFRELQIAELVALGRTNAAIGRELWITENSVKQALKRMFCKLEVAFHAEMVALLYW